MMTEFNSPQPDLMKIYSWNVLCFNRKLPEVVSYIRELDYDVLCLQEVTPELLEELKKLPVHLAYHVDVIRLMPDKRRFTNYVAIVSKHPFSHTGTLQFFDFPFPLHTRLFVLGMSLVKWSFVTERGAVYVDVEIQGKKVRVFSVHLTLWGPHNRAKEFDEVISRVEDAGSTVICGDFNVIDYGPMKILNWLLGAPLSQGMPWYPERDLFEQRFEKAGLSNPLKGKVTHPFSRSQLDHVLISADLTAENAGVEPDAHGSDHQPVYVTLT